MSYNKSNQKGKLPPGTEELLKKGYPLGKAINIAGLKKKPVKKPVKKYKKK